MNRFVTWSALIAATCYFILLGFFYSFHPQSIAVYAQKHPLQMLGALVAAVVIALMSARLTADQKQVQDLSRLSVDPAGNPLAQPLSFGAAMRKKPATLAFLFVSAFGLPPLIRLSKLRPGAIPFTREFWHSVAIGELVMAAALIAGWFAAKRKYERNLKR